LLRLTSLGRERSAIGASSVARTRCERFAFGGVAFELLCEQGGSAAALSADELRFCVSGQNAKVIADVCCAVHEDPAFGETAPALRGGAGFVSAQRSQDWVRFRAADTVHGAIAIEAPGFAADLSPLGSTRYAAAVRLGSGPDGYAGLLRAVAAAVLHRHGGLVLHAAALELDGRAVLFVGPSGVGKSTAVALSDAGRCFAQDQVALVPSESGWFAWGLPGGTPARALLAPEAVYPLAAVLRVHQAGSGEPQLQRLAGAEALSAVRESIDWADESLAGERMYLRAATQLSSTIPIGAIGTVMRRSISASIRAFLAGAGVGERPS
jgi:hypothetical protein